MARDVVRGARPEDEADLAGEPGTLSERGAVTRDGDEADEDAG